MPDILRCIVYGCPGAAEPCAACHRATCADHRDAEGRCKVCQASQSAAAEPIQP